MPPENGDHKPSDTGQGVSPKAFVVVLSQQDFIAINYLLRCLSDVTGPESAFRSSPERDNPAFLDHVKEIHAYTLKTQERFSMTAGQNQAISAPTQFAPTVKIAICGLCGQLAQMVSKDGLCAPCLTPAINLLARSMQAEDMPPP